MSKEFIVNEFNQIDLIKQPITITETARTEIKRLMSEQDISPIYLRFGIEPGGCAGMSYSMDFVAEKTGTDREYLTDEIPVLIDKESLQYLSGLTLDYKNALVGGGFKFSNPNARRSCGCGTSFRC